jgi:dipeptidyl-peptidase 4
MRCATVLLSIVISLALSTLGESDQPPAIDTTFIRDYALTRGFMLGRPTSAKATPDGKAVLFLRSPPRSPAMTLFEFDVATKQTRELLTPADLLKGAEETLSPEEKARRERMRVTARGFTAFQLSEDGSLILLQLSGKMYVVSRADKKIRVLPAGKGTVIDPKFSPDGKCVSYVLDHDVYVMDLATLKERRITTGGTEEVSHGLAEFVAQEEMNRFSGYWWSPDSQWIAYEEADARDVELWHVADPMKPGDEPRPQRYPRPGKSNVKVRLGIVSAGEQSRVSDRVTWVKWDSEKYPYLATVAWQKGGPLTILVQTRSQREEALLSVDHKTGETTTLLTEKDAAWLNIDQNVPKWLEDGSGFVWISEREWAGQLEFHDRAGRLVRVLVPPGEGLADLASVDGKTRRVYYTASADPKETHLRRLSLDNPSEPASLTEQTGLHGIGVSKNHEIQIRQFTGPRTMPRTTVHDVDGKLLAELPPVAEEPPFLPNCEYTGTFTKLKEAMIPGAPVTKLGRKPPVVCCSIIRPRNFDPTRKYPVIVYVYGGPTLQVVTQAVGRNLLLQWLADQGFLVVSSDNRGTPRRTWEWERSIVGNFGSIPLDDQVYALKAMAAGCPQMDLERVGITGWSFGGYMSALAVLRRPDVFKCAVAGAPVVDWEDYDTHYTERYLGLPKENPQGYKESNLLTYAADLKRPLLLIHGTADDNVFFLHSLKLSDALFRAGKDHEILPLSGLTHMVSDPVVRQRLEERVVRFFQKHLQP